MIKKLTILVLTIAVLMGIVGLIFKKQTPPPADLYSLIVGDAQIKVELAESQGARAQGLGGRKSLPQDQGMFFIFEKSEAHPFWMRDMQFPLDIIWLDENYKVVYIEKNIDPATYPKSFGPDVPTQYVLEINAGWAEKNKINAGSQAVFSRPH